MPFAVLAQCDQSETFGYTFVYLNTELSMEIHAVGRYLVSINVKIYSAGLNGRSV
jgi:hypothetical protein